MHLLSDLSERGTAACKEGAEITDCPSQGVCGAGRLLTCNLPFTTTEDSSDCILTAEVEEEAQAVVEALR